MFVCESRPLFTSSQGAWCQRLRHVQSNLPLPLHLHRGGSVVCARRESRYGSGETESRASAFMAPPVPTTLLRSDYAHSQTDIPDLPLTVYSLRLTTGFARGAALSEPFAGVNICLIGEDGRSVMHRVAPLNDPEETEKEIDSICQVVDNGVGADCLTATSQHCAPSGKASKAKLRFQQGTVDEICFLAPELGSLAGILVATEQGSWLLDEVTVSSSRTSHIDRFVCRRTLGSRRGDGAAYLTPVPPGAIIYGTGESAVVLSKEEASTLHAMSLAEYEDLKQRLITTTAILTASGSGVAGLAAGLEAAIPFALGGLAGVAYQWLLQQGVDNIVISAGVGTSAAAAVKIPDGGDDEDLDIQMRSTSSPTAGYRSTLHKLVSNPATRLAFVGLAAVGAITMLQGSSSVGACSGLECLLLGRQQMWQLLVGMLGFMTYKVALLSTALAQPSKQPMKLGVRKH